MSVIEDRYVPPPLPQNGYEFVAAAALFRNFGGLSVYVKYKGGPTDKITVKAKTGNYIWLICPDRELVLVQNNYSMEAFYPWADGFDECINFNMFDDHVAKRLGITQIMTNYVHSKGTKNSRLPARLPPEDRITVLSDSGGLQLSREVSGLIHPKDLATFYKENVDAGMTLDIPLFGMEDAELLDRAARLQRRNTEIMIKYKGDVELLNIFHGKSYEERNTFRKIVETSEINRCAIGGVGHDPLLTSVNNIYSIVNEGQRYKQYHVLGIFIATHIPVLVKLANSGENPPFITSDSTSHIQSASNRAYHYQFDILHTSRRIAIGSNGAIPSPLRQLPCQCLVCTTLKYTDILAFGEGRILTEMLAIHNAIEMSRYSAQLQQAAVELSPKEYNLLVRAQLKRHPKLKEVEASLDFIDLAVNKTLKAAQTKYSAALSKKPMKASNLGLGLAGLFGDGDPEASVSGRFGTTKEEINALMQRMEDQITPSKKKKTRLNADVPITIKHDNTTPKLIKRRAAK